MRELTSTFSRKEIFKNHGQLMTEAVVLSGLSGNYFAAKEMRAKAEKYGQIYGDANMTQFMEFEEIPSIYRDALSWFWSKGVATASDLKGLESLGSKKAWTLAEDGSDIIKMRVGAKLQTAIKDGQNLKDWFANIDDVFDSAGLSELNPSYWQTVLRNASQGSYNVGKRNTFQAAGDEFPQIQILTVEDNRVRRSHAKLHGFTAPSADPVWHRLTPPFGHRCRCTISAVHISEGLQNTKDMPDITAPGFDFISGRPLSKKAKPNPKRKKAATRKEKK